MKKIVSIMCAALVTITTLATGVSATTNVSASEAQHQAKDFTYIIQTDPDGSKIARVTGYTGTDGIFVVPAEVDGYEIKRIGCGYKLEGADKINTLELVGRCFDDNTIQICSNAFIDSQNLEKLNITGDIFFAPDSFNNCKNLKSININNGNISSIGSSAFRDCKNLTGTINLEKCNLIEKDAFNGCGKIQNINLGDRIDMAGFESCKIGGYAFYGCNNVKSKIVNRKIRYNRYTPFNWAFNLDAHALDNCNIEYTEAE